MITPLPIGKIIQDAVEAMSVTGISNVNFEVGTIEQVIEELVKKDNSKTYKDKKYPLIALFTPIEVSKGGQTYGTAFVKRITIAALSTQNELVKSRYSSEGNFKTILYPCYKEFLEKLCERENVMESDPMRIKHRLIEAPGVEPIPQTTDFVDCLHLDNFEFSILQQSKC